MDADPSRTWNDSVEAPLEVRDDEADRHPEVYLVAATLLLYWYRLLPAFLEEEKRTWETRPLARCSGGHCSAGATHFLYLEDDLVWRHQRNSAEACCIFLPAPCFPLSNRLSSNRNATKRFEHSFSGLIDSLAVRMSEGVDGGGSHWHHFPRCCE